MSTQITTSIIIASPPFNSIAGKEGVDLALVCAAFDQQVNLIFVDSGVLHLSNAQDEKYYLDKMHDKQLGALEFYDVEKIYVEAESLARYQLTEADLIDSVEPVSRAQINQLVNNSNHTVNF